MSTRNLVDPALLRVLDAFPTVALTTELLGPMREAERFAQFPVAAPPAAIEEILKTAVLDSSPVPTPSEESFSSNFAQYLIPLVFGDSN